MEENSVALEKFKKATNKLYTRLIGGLKGLTGINGWEVLYKLEYISFENCDSPEDLKSFGGICPFNIVKKDNENYFRCVCGKPHIKNLTIMKYPAKTWDYCILGSDCVESTIKYLEDLDDIHDIENLYDKLSVWYKEINNEKKKLTHKKCVSCKEYNVNKTTKYKNPARFYWCNKCCGGDMVCCINCKKDRVFQLDWKNKPMLYCRNCYFSQLPSPSSSQNI